MSSGFVVALSLMAALVFAVLSSMGADAKVLQLAGAGDDMFSSQHQPLPAADRPAYGFQPDAAAPSQTLRYAQSAVRYGTACITERGICSVPRPVPVNTGCYCRTPGGRIGGRVLN